MVKLGRDLTAQGFEPAIRCNDRKTVHVGWVRMPGLLREVGLANLREQKLSIKLEIDTHPPAGAFKQAGVVNRHVIFAVRYHDLPSLMAGKIHALLARPYSKGRDWYDLLWYLSRRPLLEPNLRLLQNALDQTEWESSMVAGDWRQSVRVRIDNLEEDVIREDFVSFLERPQDALLLTRDNLIEILSRD